MALLSPPRGFRDELIGLPDGVRILTRAAGAPDLIVWFVGSRRTLDARIPRMRDTMGQGLWIAWPKKASGVKTDLTEDAIRGAGLANGLVDYKVCAINETWSGLKVAKRLDKKPAMKS